MRSGNIGKTSIERSGLVLATDFPSFAVTILFVATVTFVPHAELWSFCGWTWFRDCDKTGCRSEFLLLYCDCLWRCSFWLLSDADKGLDNDCGEKVDESNVKRLFSVPLLCFALSFLVTPMLCAFRFLPVRSWRTTRFWGILSWQMYPGDRFVQRRCSTTDK